MVRTVRCTEILAVIADWFPEEQQTFAELMNGFAHRFVAWAVDDVSESRERVVAQP
jgi:hypothetical protein